MVRKANIIQKQELGGGKGCAEVQKSKNICRRTVEGYA